MEIIITADDYGLSRSVNEAIEACLAAGATRATCVMMNMPEWAHAARLRARYPTASLGIHWNLTQGKPVSDAARVPSLTGPSGDFAPSLRRRWLRGEVDRAHVRSELTAQWLRFREAIGEPDFWNTHQDVHIWPGLFHLFLQLGKELGVPAMRSHRRTTVPRGRSALAYNVRHPAYWLKGRVVARWADQAAVYGMALPAGRLLLIGYATEWASLREGLARAKQHNGRSPLELVIHPATRIDSPRFGRLTDQRIRDYELFSRADLIERLRQIGVHPVGFEALHQAGGVAGGGQAA